MNIVAIINQKGGTGKTTTAVNTSAGLARKGHKVLLIDLDPQAHATYGLGIDLDENASMPGIASIFYDSQSRIEDSLVRTMEPNLTIVPADVRLAKAAALLHSRNHRDYVLSNALDNVQGFDYIIIDCQPTLDVLALNALVAANKILIPTQLAGHALRGFTDLLFSIEDIKGDDKNYDWRILLTMVTGIGEERQEYAAKILEPVQDRILKTRIRRTEAIEKSQMETDDEPLIPVILKKNWNRGAQDYRNLVKELAKLWPV